MKEKTDIYYDDLNPLIILSKSSTCKPNPFNILQYLLQKRKKKKELQYSRCSLLLSK